MNVAHHPHALLMVPVFDKLHDPNSDIVAFYMGVVPFDRYFAKLLPEGVDGIFCVLRNSCGQSYTYELDGNRVSTNTKRISQSNRRMISYAPFSLCRQCTSGKVICMTTPMTA